MSEQVANRLLVIGLGLIGGSLAKKARQEKLFAEVIGCSRSPGTLKRAIAEQVVDRVEFELEQAAAELGPGDILVLAMPTLSVPEIIRRLHPVLDPRVTVTDVASVKGSIVASVKKIYDDMPAQFVPGHPIAGSEKSGIGAANPDLFVDHRVILTPGDETGADHVARVERLWQRVGAIVSKLSVEEHDEILAATSHLPHILAFSLVDTLASMRENQEIFRYAAGGFRDFTRIAASDPVMWHDIALANRKSLLHMIDRLNDNLARLRQAIDGNDSDYLLGVFSRAREARNHFSKILENKAYFESAARNIDFKVNPGGVCRGVLRVPGDKSISHRAIMLGSLADGITEVSGFLEGEDSLATLQAFRDLGVVIEGPIRGRVVIHGVGLHGLKPPPGPLYLGNAGTSMRLLAGLLAGQKFDTELTGDESLSKRPMARVAKPLREMGAVIETAESGTPPLKIHGNRALKGIEYQLPMASAQVKSCVLLAGLYADGSTTVTEPAPTRDHTERMLKGCGYPVSVHGNRITVTPGGRLGAVNIDVPADISSAAFFMVAASIAPGSDITLMHVGVNPTRTGVINILRHMGADISVENEKLIGGEPVADIRVKYAALRGIEIPTDQVPLAIDEFPVLFVAAACAEGETLLTGARELRVKESDRIQSMADGLQILGIDARPTEDGMWIRGGHLTGGQVDSHGDHRIAMAFAVAGLRASGPIRIRNCSNVATSFPGFVELAGTAGLEISEEST